MTSSPHFNTGALPLFIQDKVWRAARYILCVLDLISCVKSLEGALEDPQTVVPLS